MSNKTALSQALTSNLFFFFFKMGGGGGFICSICLIHVYIWIQGFYCYIFYYLELFCWSVPSEWAWVLVSTKIYLSENIDFISVINKAHKHSGHPLFFWHIYARNIYLFNVFSLFCTFQILDFCFKTLHLKENLAFRFKHFIIHYLDFIFCMNMEHSTVFCLVLELEEYDSLRFTTIPWYILNVLFWTYGSWVFVYET